MIPQFLQNIDWVTSLVVIAVAIVAFVLVMHFMGGGVKKSLTLLAIVASAGLALFLVNRGGREEKHRKNYENATRAYEEAKAKRERAEAEIRLKEDRIKRLNEQAGDQEEAITQSLDELDALKKQRVDATVEMAKHETDLAENKKQLGQGYQPDSSGSLLEELQRRVQDGGGATKVADPSPMREPATIDVEQDGFRLKGDVS